MTTLRTRLFQTYARLRRPMTLGIRAIVENAAGDVLLVRHTYMKGWHLPGGGVERGETCADSLRREILEEGGIILTGEARMTGIYSNHRVFRNDHIVLYHIAHGHWQQGKATALGEIAETRWCAPSDLPDGTTRGTLLRLEETYKGAEPSTYWVPQQA